MVAATEVDGVVEAAVGAAAVAAAEEISVIRKKDNKGTLQDGPPLFHKKAHPSARQIATITGEGNRVNFKRHQVPAITPRFRIISFQFQAEISLII